MIVRTWLAVSVYVVIAQAFLALKNGTGPHTGERRFKCGGTISTTPRRHALYSEQKLKPTSRLPRGGSGRFATVVVKMVGH